jgi:uncharacterized protein (DUF1330 family)
MTKAYWIACYREISDPAKLAAYAKIAGPAIEAGGGRFLARTVAAQAYEDGKVDRTVLIEFDSVEQAVAVHDGAAYQAALALLKGGVVRDLRIVQGT